MKYRAIHCRMWNDAKFQSLSDKAKLLFLYLITHPNQTALGAFRSSVSGLCSELGWEPFPEPFREPFNELSRNGFTVVNENACYIEVTNFLKYNRPANPNAVKAMAKAVEMIPECEEKTKLIQKVMSFLEQFPEPFREPFNVPIQKPFSNSSPNKELGTRNSELGTRKKEEKTKREPASEPIPPDQQVASNQPPIRPRTPPEFDNDLAVVWDRLDAVAQASGAFSAKLGLTQARRYALRRALDEIGGDADRLVAGFRWCLTAPAAEFVRDNWRGIDTYLAADKTMGYVEASEAPNAWRKPGDRAGPKVESKLERMKREAAEAEAKR